MPHRTVALLLLATAAALETLHLSNKRSCLFHAPEETTTPVPLVVVLHGYNVEPLNTLDFYFSDLKRLAEERGLAIAAPRGRRLGARGNDGSLCWAAGACCCRTKTKDDADVSFIDEVVEAVRRRAAISALVLVGHSNGGSLALRVACARRDVDALAIFNAPLTHDRAVPATRLYLRHGAADAMLGGREASRVAHPHVPGVGVRETVAREHRNCAAPVVFDVVDELGHWPSSGLLQTDLRAPLLFAIYGEPITAASAKNNVRLGRPTRIK
ncbi:hypothetical protein JL720_7562 [Aureococcus anophagefferens]|nr:hypothetical protein JL720_7562 [Aureococcus anophagefferens]